MSIFTVHKSVQVIRDHKVMARSPEEAVEIASGLNGETVSVTDELSGRTLSIRECWLCGATCLSEYADGDTPRDWKCGKCEPQKFL